MPFIRACHLVHPSTGLPGLWVELSTDPPGTLTGLAQTAFPNPVLTGPVAGRDTLETYATKVNTSIGTLCRKTLGGVVGQVVNVTITFSSLDPVTISNVVITEGDLKSFVVGGA